MPSTYLLLDNLRKERNAVERTMSALKPDESQYPKLYEEWEDAMEDLGRMYRTISDLMAAHKLHP